MDYKKKYIKYKLKYLTAKKIYGGMELGNMKPPPTPKHIVNNHLFEIIGDLYKNGKVLFDDFVSLYNLNNFEDLNNFILFYFPKYNKNDFLITELLKPIKKYIEYNNITIITYKHLKEIWEIINNFDNFNYKHSYPENPRIGDLSEKNLQEQLITYHMNYHKEILFEKYNNLIQKIYDEQFEEHEGTKTAKCKFCKDEEIMFPMNSFSQFLFKKKCLKCNNMNYSLDYP